MVSQGELLTPPPHSVEWPRMADSSDAIQPFWATECGVCSAYRVNRHIYQWSVEPESRCTWSDSVAVIELATAAQTECSERDYTVICEEPEYDRGIVAAQRRTSTYSRDRRSKLWLPTTLIKQSRRFVTRKECCRPGGRRAAGRLNPVGACVRLRPRWALPVVRDPAAQAAAVCITFRCSVLSTSPRGRWGVPLS